MKRMVVFFLVIGLLIGASFLVENDFSPFLNFNRLVIVSSKPLTYRTFLIQNGNDFYYEFDKNQLEVAINDKDHIKCYIFYFFNNLTKKDFNQYFDFIYQGNISEQNYTIYYGYYSGYSDYEIISGKKVNFQLVQTSTQWILGFPMIMTGF